jgi:hypothetical protein
VSSTSAKNGYDATLHAFDKSAGKLAQHDKSAAQVMLRWDLQEGRSAIPKSTKPARIAENFDTGLSLAGRADQVGGGANAVIGSGERSSFECTSSARSPSSRAIAELESVLGIVRDVN